MNKQLRKSLIALSALVTALPALAVERSISKTLCSEMTDGPNKESFTATFEGTRLLLRMDKSDSKDFAQIRIDLIEACQNRKPIDLSFDDQTQHITKFRMPKKKKKAPKGTK